jgi:hypothetical protein
MIFKAPCPTLESSQLLGSLVKINKSQQTSSEVCSFHSPYVKQTLFLQIQLYSKSGPMCS